MTEPVSNDLKQVLRRLKLSRMLDTLPERLVTGRHGKMPHQEFLLLILSDEVSRRQGNAVRLRAERGASPASRARRMMLCPRTRPRRMIERRPTAVSLAVICADSRPRGRRL